MATNDGWETISPAAPVAAASSDGWETIAPAKPAVQDTGIRGDIHNIARTSAETVPSAAAGTVGFGAGTNKEIIKFEKSE